MRHYTIKLIIVFILTFITFGWIAVFSYGQISKTFIAAKASENLIHVGEGVGRQIDGQVRFDYENLNTMIESFREQGLNPVNELYMRQSTILANGYPYTGFGTIQGNEITIQGQIYTYRPSYTEEDYQQKYQILSFRDAFNMGGDQRFFMFRFDDVIAYAPIESYVTNLINISSFDVDYTIMGTDNIVFYHSFSDNQERFFYDYLRKEGMQEPSLLEIMQDVNSGLSFSVQAPFLGVSSFYVFIPILKDYHTPNLVLTLMADEEAVIGSMSLLTITLIAIFIAIFIVFALSMIIIYQMIHKKLNDIEDAKIAHFYAKPYIFRINKDGKIKSMNRSLQLAIKENNYYHHVDDLKLSDRFEKESIYHMIDTQRAFTVIFELSINKTLYVRFIPLKIFGGYILIGEDITRIEAPFEQYRELALFNSVTRLPNLNSLNYDLKDLFNDPIAFEQKNALVALDIIAFNKFNLLLGEKNADRFLYIFAEIVNETLEGYPATLYNLQKDQFVVLFTGIEAYDWPTKWVEKLDIVLDKPITIDRSVLTVDIKAGIFNFEKDKYEIFTPEVCIENMMLALIHAKESAVHTHYTYDVSLSLVASRDQSMEQDLAVAIQRKEFYLVLQPQYSNQLQKIIGFEALVRWNNPKYKGDSPQKFIEMAEHNNMIIDIGRIIIEETCKLAKELEPYDVEISFNVSPVQLLQAGFVNDVIRFFNEYKVKKGMVSIEVTETFLISSFELVIAKLRLLRNHGFNIHLDDFGSGYSSLQYLRDLPVNAIKIDRAFIKDIENDQHSKAIVTMVSNLAKSVNLEVIAEGVENERQNQIVMKSGCQIIQGYFISKPVVKEEAIELIQAYNIDKTMKVDQPRSQRTREGRR